MKKNCDKKVKKYISRAKKTKSAALIDAKEEEKNDLEKNPLENLEKMELADEPYEEIYFDEYAEKRGGDQKYGIKRNRDQYYKKNEDETEEVFAKKYKGEELEEFYAHTASMVEFLPKKKVGDNWIAAKYRRDANNRYFYPYNDLLHKEEYEYEENGDPKLALDQHNKQYYPSKKDLLTDDFIQYIPTTKDGVPFYIIEEGKQLYPKNVTQNYFVYPKDSDGNEYYLKDENNEDYYMKNGNDEVYATVMDKHLLKNKIIIRNNKPTYAKINNGEKEIYPYNKTLETEEYVIDLGKPIWALDEDNKPYYPSHKFIPTNEMIQFIPIENGRRHIITENGKQIYPKNLTRNIYVYGKDGFDSDEYYLKDEENEEYYIENEQGNQIYASDKTGINKFASRNGEPVYAREGNKEIYPRYGPGKSQFYKMIGSKEHGARLNTEQNNYYYAKDENLNEFYPKDFSLPEDEEETSSDEETISDEADEDKERIPAADIDSGIANADSSKPEDPSKPEDIPNPSNTPQDIPKPVNTPVIPRTTRNFNYPD